MSLTKGSVTLTHISKSYLSPSIKCNSSFLDESSICSDDSSVSLGDSFVSLGDSSVSLDESSIRLFH